MYKIIKTTYYGRREVQSPVALAESEGAARAWIDRAMSGIYRLDHEESARPTYRAVPITESGWDRVLDTAAANLIDIDIARAGERI